MIFRAAVLLATVAAAPPADARERRRDRAAGDGVAAFVAGAVIAGGLVALLAGRKAAIAAPLPELAPAENDAANLCADAVERQMIDGDGNGDGREARVERFDSVAAREKGGYKVKGRVRVADAGDGYAMRFACIVKGAEVRNVTVSI